ncbi:MAG: TonB-dependent receptor plug domain-containing protein, partial [Sphingomonadales bacterium]|nr:TonB-dependent receptor plug domain-containing protein [Sphingomonadales bacterium]
MTKVNHTSALLLSTALGAMISGPLFAADGAMLEEVTVTATKMGETKLQETPLAITAFTSDQMAKTGIKEVRDLMALTPNLNIAQNQAFAQIYIRGVGSNNIFVGADPSSTIHIDGVYMARPASYFSGFLDVERVEVLRGPQGTLYGRNSVGGTINVISRKPDNDLRAKVQGTIGNYDLYRAEGYISGPLIEDKLAGSVSLMRSKRDGYLDNIVPGVKDLDSEDMWSGRVQLRATPSEKLEILLRGDYMEDDGQIAGNAKLLLPWAPLEDTILDDLHKVALDTEGFMERKNRGVSAEINYDFSDTLNLTSITAYRKNTLHTLGDTDATSSFRQTTEQNEWQDQFSQELNLAGQWERLKYVLGFYYFEEDMRADSYVRNH